MLISESKPGRVTSIDLLRGLVMIIMALDHTRDFFHSTAYTEDPLDLNNPNPALFFTRWITHFCAPVFVFLSGASAWLQGQRKSKKELSLFLVRRGFWLVLVELIIINLVYSFDIYFSSVALTTIWSIGVSMIILGLIIWLPFAAILLLGLVIVSGHNLLDYYEKANAGSLTTLYQVFHRPVIFQLGYFKILALYPILPWAGLMMLGFCFGKLLTRFNGTERKKILLYCGAGITLLFLLLRLTDVYGDPDVINGTDSPRDSLYAFLETNKYPPSLLFMCMTIGPSLLFLAAMDTARGKWVDFISVYGRVAFFYYIVHFFLIHTVSTIFFFLRGHSISEGIDKTGMVPWFMKPGEGYNLLTVYIVWISVVIVLYPVCRKYDNYKRKNRQKWWLSYM